MFDKIHNLTNQLSDEIVNFNILVSNNEIRDKELNTKENTLTGREAKVASRENIVLQQTHKLEEDRKELVKNTLDYDNKQAKLQEEWQRMTIDREKLNNDLDNFAKDKLRLDNREKELDVKETKINDSRTKIDTDKEMLDKKQEALNVFNSKLNQKKKITEEKAKKIDEMYAEAD